MKLLRWVSLAVLGIAMVAAPSVSQAQVAVGISVRIGPPALPIYEQPFCPGDGYIWVPGYWAYGPDGYFWVPGTWVLPPEAGLLWTPGYWGWASGFYVWHRGYWGPHVGFYGGINYGFGYPGTGFYGGYWSGRRYFYNRSVTRVNVTIIHNTYDRRVVERNFTRVSFNGGRGGINARPTREEIGFERDRRFGPTGVQERHREDAGRDRGMWASQNRGRPNVAATPRPGEFRGREGDRPNRDNHNMDRPVRGNAPNEMNRPRNNRPNDRPPTAGDRPHNASERGRVYSDRYGRNDRPPSAMNAPRNDSRPNRGYADRPAPNQNAPHSNRMNGNEARGAQNGPRANGQRANQQPPRQMQGNPRGERRPDGDRGNGAKPNGKPNHERGGPHGR